MTPSPQQLELYMNIALEEAAFACEQNEVPVGAIVVKDGQVISRAHNETERLQDPTAHAEILALRAACQKEKNWRLTDCMLVVTLEPCTMCIGAIREARIPMLVFGTKDERLGACGSLYDLSIQKSLGPVPRVVQGIERERCADILKVFFTRLRSRKSEKNT